MQKKTANLSAELDAARVRQDEIYKEILEQVVEPHRVSSLLRELEASAQRRDYLSRELYARLYTPKQDWWRRLFR